jgi:osmotically-inducible protein OsmY
MIDSEAVIERVRHVLRRDPRIDFDYQAIGLTFANGALLLSGEVGDIAQKRLAAERAATAPAVTTVVDELRVRPKETLPDAEIGDLVRTALVEEPALAGCTIREHVRGGFRPVHSPLTSIGRIDIGIAQGVVTLAGEVPSLAQKRLSGVLAWRCPGTRDVVNSLDVRPVEEDSDAAICDAVQLVLDRDPAIHAAGIRVAARDAHVALDGTVPAASEVTAAEHDAWFVFGVRNVVNRLAVAAAAGN